MRLSGTVKLCTVFAIIIIAFSSLYFSFFMPFWNFMVNAELQDADLVELDPISSFTIDRKTYNPVGTPNKETPGPNETPDPDEQTNTIPEVEEGTLNFLILGADESAGLVDTIIVANVNTKTKEIKLISIPRDTYVPYGSKITNRIIQAGLNNVKGIYKINAAPYIGEHVVNYQGGKFENKGINFLCDTIELMLGYKIDEYVHVNFDGFVEIVDIFGGVKVTSSENIYNHKGELIVKKGVNEMDGKTALFFARARYRYDEFGNSLPSPGDSYRKEHQLSMLQEMASQVVTLQNISRARDILNSLKKNVHHSVTMSELPYYSTIAIDYANGLYKIDSLVIRGKVIDPFGDNASYVDIMN